MAFAARNTKNGKANSSKTVIHLPGIAGSIVALNRAQIYKRLALQMGRKGA